MYYTLTYRKLNPAVPNVESGETEAMGRGLRKKTNAHPGQIINDQKQVRRTREQVDADEARDAAEKEEAEKAAKLENEAKLARTVEIQRAAQKRDGALKRSAIRPDLANVTVDDTQTEPACDDGPAKQAEVEGRVELEADDGDVMEYDPAE